MRNQYPYQYQMLNYTYINAFKVGVYTLGSYQTKRQYRDFRTLLFQELFEFYQNGEVARRTSVLGSQRLDLEVQYIYRMLLASKHPYTQYSYQKALQTSRSRTPSPKKRYFSNEINPNIPIGPISRSNRIKGSYYSYRVYLYRTKQRDCQQMWYSQEPRETPQNYAKPYQEGVYRFFYYRNRRFRVSPASRVSRYIKRIK